MIDHGDTKQTFERSAIAAAVISFVSFAVGAASAAGGWLGGATVTIVALVAGAAGTGAMTDCKLSSRRLDGNRL
ncbi:MAG TPA: hypothetical protein VFM96_12400 [Gaiellaceae bacterium]|nr:hypothetical protein [Gaiellaceae bacterium]